MKKGRKNTAFPEAEGQEPPPSVTGFRRFCTTLDLQGAGHPGEPNRSGHIWYLTCLAYRDNVCPSTV